MSRGIYHTYCDWLGCTNYGTVNIKEQDELIGLDFCQTHYMEWRQDND